MKKYFPIILVTLFVYTVPFWMFCQRSLQYEKIEMSQSDKNSIIEQALNIELLPVNTIVSEEANAFSQEATIKVHECNYEEAIKITLFGLEKFPQNFTLQSDLAALLGDCSEITAEPLKERMIKKSKIMFDKLIKEADGQSKKAFYSFKNEYYFRFALYREQYELGLVRVADYWGTNERVSYGFRGYYSQGVGAANYAKKLIEQGDKSLAREYAQKALVAWAQYFSYKNDYYNSYVHYALALGIIGYKEEMMRALQRSASLINRDLSYHEFKEVIDFVENVH